MAGVLDIDSPDFDADAFVTDIQQRGQAAEEDTVWQKIAETQAAGKDAWKGQAKASEDMLGWVKKLPKNLTVGATNAALAMAGLVDDIGGVIAGQNLKFKDENDQLIKSPALPTPLRDPIVAWRDEATRDNVFADDLTQGIAQFVVPFSMFTKMANVSKATSVLGAAGRLAGAEAAAVGTGFGPHDARGADLMQMGREAEGKFGDVMRKVSPDGSLLNSYIDYMTDREDEGNAEGRFKNIVDSLALSAATAGLIKAVPFGLKAGRYALENAGTGPAFGSKAAQGGWIGFHGTPHSFDKYDINKVGAGEGNQTYGHGLYFAEEKAVAEGYRRRLTTPAGRVDGTMEEAVAYLGKHDGDRAKAYKELTARADMLDRQGSGVDAREARKAAELIKSGNAKLRGELHTVHVPDEVVATMGNWDSPRYSQPAVVNKAFDDLGNLSIARVDGKWQATLEGKPVGKKYANVGELTTAIDALTGNDRLGLKFGTAYQQLSDLLGSDKAASEFLRDRGVGGIRYLDGNSRNGADGTRNLVLFDDKHATIKEKK